MSDIYRISKCLFSETVVGRCCDGFLYCPSNFAIVCNALTAQGESFEDQESREGVLMRLKLNAMAFFICVCTKGRGNCCQRIRSCGLYDNGAGASTHHATRCGLVPPEVDLACSVPVLNKRAIWSSPKFFALFWGMSSYDIFLPKKRYAAEIMKKQNEYSTLRSVSQHACALHSRLLPVCVGMCIFTKIVDRTSQRSRNEWPMYFRV